MHILPLISLLTVTLAADLQQIINFGPNPSNVSFYLYIPATLSSSPPLLVYPHWCHGDALSAFANKPWRGLADALHFPIIFPSSPHASDSCWDVSSAATLAHDAGGDSLAIASMARWVLRRYPQVDRDRVFVTGVSSGAMMTNVLLATYPDLFAAGSAFAGVPFGCFAGDGSDVWSDACATGQVTHSPYVWSRLVHSAYPAYKGVRPKIQLLHGTADEVLNVTNYHEEIKQWTAVLGTPTKPTLVEEDTPQEGWTKYVYGRKGLVEGFLAEGVTHDIPDQVDEVVRFFELDCVGHGCFSRRTLEKLENDRARLVY